MQLVTCDVAVIDHAFTSVVPRQCYVPDVKPLHSLVRGRSQPIVLAATAGLNIALRAPEDETGHSISTLLAAVLAVNPQPCVPGAMITLMAIAKQAGRPRDLLCISRTTVLAVCDVLCTSEQPALVPLRTSAGLPYGAADVAELGAADTAVMPLVLFYATSMDIGHSRHVIAPSRQFDHAIARRALLPALFGG